MSPEVADAIRLLDDASISWPVEAQAAWKKVRGFARARHRDSQRSMPALSLAAQEVVQVRNHAQAALDAMEGVFGHHSDEEQPDTAKHPKPVEDPSEPR